MWVCFEASLFLLFVQEATQCIEELGAQGPLHVFVKVGVEFTLERSQITRDHMGQLLYQLVQSEKLSKQDFFKGLVSSHLSWWVIFSINDLYVYCSILTSCAMLIDVMAICILG